LSLKRQQEIRYQCIEYVRRNRLHVTPTAQTYAYHVQSLWELFKNATEIARQKIAYLSISLRFYCARVYEGSRYHGIINVSKNMQ